MSHDACPMLDRLIDRFLDHIQVLAWSPKTIVSYRTHLGVFCRYLASELSATDIGAVTSETLLQYQTRLYEWTDAKGRGRSVATQAGRLSALRSFFRFLVRTNVLQSDPSSTLVLPKRRHTLPRSILTKREVKRLLAAPDPTIPLGLRDRAILEVLYSTGVRNAELRSLKFYDLDFHRGIARINQGKNGMDRVVPLGRAASIWVRQYLELARPRLRGSAHPETLGKETVFISRTGRPLDGQGVIYALRKYGRQARIRKKITPHTLRHTCATHMLAGRADLRHIQAMLGHRSIASTQIYTQVEITDLKAVHRRCHPRGGRP